MLDDDNWETFTHVEHNDFHVFGCGTNCDPAIYFEAKFLKLVTWWLSVVDVRIMSRYVNYDLSTFHSREITFQQFMFNSANRFFDWTSSSSDFWMFCIPSMNSFVVTFFCQELFRFETFSHDCKICKFVAINKYENVSIHELRLKCIFTIVALKAKTFNIKLHHKQLPCRD